MAALALGALGGLAIGALSGGCVSMPFMSVGCSQDATAQIVNELTLELGNFFAVNADTKVSNIVQSVQTLTVNNLAGGILYCPGGINLEQNNVLNASVMTAVNNDITIDIQNSLITLIDNAADALAQDARDFLSRALGTTDTNAVAMIKNALHTAVTNEVKVDAITNIINRVLVQQDMVFNNAGTVYSDTCTFSQTATTDFYAQQTITNIVKSSALTEIQTQLTNQAIAEATTGKTKDKSALWITLGVILGVGLLAGVIFLIVRASKSKAAAASPIQPAPPYNPYASAYRPPAGPPISPQAVQATSVRAVKA